MRRTLRASVAGPVACGVLVASVYGSGAGLALAQPDSPQGLAGLVAAVANADQKLQDLGANIQAQQESVNKSIADLETARDVAATAQTEVDASRRGLDAANAAIASAQDRFDAFAASSYVNGPSAAYLNATDPADILDTTAVGQTLNVSTQQAIDSLQRARTEQVNRESAARLAKQKADQSVVDARDSQNAAVASLAQAQQTFAQQKGELTQLTAERAAAQAKLAQAREWSAPVVRTASIAPAAAPGQASSPDWDRDPTAAAPGNSRWDSGWDPTLPAIPSAFVSGDPIAIINQLLGYATTSSQLTSQMGHSFLQKLGLIPTESGFTNGAIPRVYGRQASEYVIRRAGSQMGVPYSWGGGTAAGPGRGIDSGAGTTGFDCSGLILYAFAGVGIKLPHYSGAQYGLGRKIPASQMRRGDVIFYGPGGAQHVTLYLGNGQMLEAPYTGSTVKVSPVRTSGMTPYVVRYIEY